MTTLMTSPSHSNSPDQSTAMRLARRFWYAGRRWWWSGYFGLEPVHAERVPASRPVIFCANHTSHLDAIAILAALPRTIALRTYTAAARDVFGSRVIPRLVSRLTTNALTVQRSAEFSGGLRQVERVLRDEHPLILFPEGKRSASGKMNPFKNGAAMLSIRTASPIVPVYIAGANVALRKGTLVPMSAKVRVEFGQPIDPAKYVEAVAAGALSRRDAYDRLTVELRSAVAAMKARHEAVGIADPSLEKSHENEAAVNLSPA